MTKAKLIPVQPSPENEYPSTTLTALDLSKIAGVVGALSPRNHTTISIPPFDGLFVVQKVSEGIFVLGKITETFTLRTENPEAKIQLETLTEDGQVVQVAFDEEGHLILFPTALKLNHLLEFEV